MQGELALIGLGRMGSNMSRRLLRAGVRCFVYDVDSTRREALRHEGAFPLTDLASLKHSISQPRIVWLMLPAGEVTEKTVQQLSQFLEEGDVIIDGGNSHYKDDIRRSHQLAKRGIRYLDVGVSGGVWGLDRGYCLMTGGDAEAAALLEPIFQVLAPVEKSVTRTRSRKAESSRTSTADHGYYYCGDAGSGHFVKMVHNGIEYGMMQAFAEGFDLLRHSHFDLNLCEIAEVWRRGSVVSSWLLDLIADALNRDEDLSRFLGSVEDSGEGRWTVQAAIEHAVPLHVISAALYVRFRSREERNYGEQLLSAMRNEFGGHPEAKPKAKKEAS